MATYARIDEQGLVAELFTPAEGFTIEDSFHDGLQWVDVSAIDPQPQPNWAYSEGIFTPTTPSIPPIEASLATQARLLLNQPVTVQCASLPALNGQYRIDMVTQAQITGVVTKLGAGRGLPGGGQTFSFQGKDWPADHFIDFADKVVEFIYAATQVIERRSTELPSTTLVI